MANVAVRVAGTAPWHCSENMEQAPCLNIAIVKILAVINDYAPVILFVDHRQSYQQSKIQIDNTIKNCEIWVEPLYVLGILKKPSRNFNV